MREYCLYFLIALAISACKPKNEAKESSTDAKVSPIPPGLASEGKILYNTCAVCHGSSGEGNKKLNAPALANSESWYLYRQLMNFKKGIRGASPQDSLGYQMAAMAKALKDSIAVSHVVAYIKTMQAVAIPAFISGDVKKGEQYYQMICGSCHGPRAIGNQKMNAPRITGLEDWYIKRQISNFKKSIRGAHPKDILGAQMIPMVALLPNDQAVHDVIAYICSTTDPVSR